MEKSSSGLLLHAGFRIYIIIWYVWSWLMKCFCLTAVICCSSLSVSAGTVQRPLHSCLPAMFRTRTSSTTHSTPPPRTNPHSSLTPPHSPLSGPPCPQCGSSQWQTAHNHQPKITPPSVSIFFALKNSGSRHQTVNFCTLKFWIRENIYLNLSQLKKGNRLGGKRLGSRPK